MKKLYLCILALFLFSAMLFAQAESDPSEIVGYVAYDMYHGFNYVALPMSSTMSLAEDLAEAIGSVDVVNKWDALTQNWETSYLLFGDWEDDYPGFVEDMGTYFVNFVDESRQDGVFYSVGGLSEPISQHSFVLGFNSFMLPLDRYDIKLAGGTDLVEELLGLADDIGPVDVVNRWDSSIQTWETTYFLFGEWEDNYEIFIGDPMYINVTEAVDWPEAANRFQTRF